MAESVVFLFDIDGTLVRSRRVGWLSILEACKILFGEVSIPEVELAGRTDRGIFQEIFANLQRREEHDLSRFAEIYHERLDQNWKAPEFEVLPGVHSLIEKIGKLPDCHLGLLTGNSYTGARTKLKRAGIWNCFQFGAFGDQEVHRIGVAQQAATLARARCGGSSSVRLITIGDTPDDVTCAKSIGSLAVAVGTGSSSRDRLVAADPDFLLEDLRDFDFEQLLS